ncbi:isocitrate lyase/PEP mutase family protein [Flexivirga alba]|uniref:Isocitrate lyase/phosphoenolpyruvate mutase family protein n=1 Tax=Flexivirga alba TaxID=702742 RepID=A0ABW2ALI1_9MICO
MDANQAARIAKNATAAELRGRHVPGRPLVIPNSWDAASAAAIERAGSFAAVATSSNAVAAVLGWEDGEVVPVDAMLAAASRIVGAVSLPVTVDFERGYRLVPQTLVERFAVTGAVGLNLEDSDPGTGVMIDVEEQVAFLRAVRAAAEAAHLDLVINARTDSFLRKAGTPDEQLKASIDRGNRYLEAGADCVYPLGASGAFTLGALTDGVDGPVNVARGVGGPPLKELAELGVARVTFGAGLQRQLYSTFESELLPQLMS